MNKKKKKKKKKVKKKRNMRIERHFKPSYMIELSSLEAPLSKFIKMLRMKAVLISD
jgi:hypothetical protein